MIDLLCFGIAIYPVFFIMNGIRIYTEAGAGSYLLGEFRDFQADLAALVLGFFFLFKAAGGKIFWLTPSLSV